jgi:hypothetical protein
LRCLCFYTSGAFTIDSSTPTFTGNLNEHLIRVRYNLIPLFNMKSGHSRRYWQSLDSSFCIILKSFLLIKMCSNESVMWISRIPNYKQYIIHQDGEVHDYSQSAKIRSRGSPRDLRCEGYKALLSRGLYTIYNNRLLIKIILADATDPA